MLVHKEGVSLSFPGLTLLKNATVKLHTKRRYGLVAPNGAGKSTLLEHLATDNTLEVCYVAQEAPASEQSALATVLAADTTRARLLADLAMWQALEEDDEQGATAAVKVRTLYQALHQRGEQTATARAARILAGLQFTSAMQQQPTATFSGGWRMRIALAGSLFAQPQLLLLDEPTNHLDLHARIWLAWYLQEQWRETVVVVSHDRAFLNKVATDIIHLQNQQLWYYHGNYDSFQQTKQLKDNAHANACKKQKKHKQRLQRMKPGKTKKQRLRQTHTKAKVAKVSRAYRVRFAFAPPAYPLSRPVFAIHTIGFHFPSRRTPLIRDLDAYLDTKSRIAIVGANGVGKTTLLKVLAGAYTPTSGRIERHRKLKLASFGQHLETLNPTESAITYVQRMATSMGPPQSLSMQEARRWLGSMGLPGAAHCKPIAQLSGGQKCRVVLSWLAQCRSHLLLLDEPSNHLDMESVEALATALAAYEGGIVLISHNAYLIERVTDTLWILPGDGSVTIDTMSLSDYRESLIRDMQTD